MWKRKFGYLIQGLLLLAALFQSQGSHAALMFSIERVSDTTARVTGTGSLDVVGSVSENIIYLDDIFNSLLTGSVNEDALDSGTLTLGGQSITLGYTISTGFTPVAGSKSGIYFGASSDFSSGDFLSAGYLDFDISLVSTSPIFASAGSTGTVYSGLFNTSAAIAGTWEIIDPTNSTVPAPTTLALFGLGLAGLGWSRRTRA